MERYKPHLFPGVNCVCSNFTRSSCIPFWEYVLQILLMPGVHQHRDYRRQFTEASLAMEWQLRKIGDVEPNVGTVRGA